VIAIILFLVILAAIIYLLCVRRPSGDTLAPGPVASDDPRFTGNNEGRTQ
jgi:hypothetical protein